MIKEIVLEKTTINYQIDFKRNKNTYFYFKSNGYIQINASRYQKEKDIIKFMKKNSEAFVNKYNKALDSIDTDEGYRIWGIEYYVSNSNESDKLSIDHSNFTIVEPNFPVDQTNLKYKYMEKELLLNEGNILKERHLNNGLIDIKNIKIRTRYTTSRFGSCNYRLKTINLNLKLVHYDKRFIEYVFLHEIAHLVHQNHSKDFYLLMSKLCPNYKQLRKELNQKFKR